MRIFYYDPPACDADGPLLVIGLGVSRTGTLSLKMALELLLGQPCYHSLEISQNHRVHAVRWCKILERLKQDPEATITADEIQPFFKGYRAATGHPACAMHRQLMEVYPESKFILPYRDSRSWLRSIRETVMPHKAHFPPNCIGRLGERILFGAKFMHMNLLSLHYAMGWGVDLTNDSQCALAFELRAEEIIQTIPEERLLIYRMADGWEPLCRFLNMPVPNIAFPQLCAFC
ncbi:unnamed protein product [Echinostoma caproni]|uniref:Sulfotransferase family protein n=1 Tax=Echinostoma caproni TaxID=27848 RepID=A0A183B009_9TREM|nr:unnamed protein product [Echinostoma caproni]